MEKAAKQKSFDLYIALFIYYVLPRGEISTRSEAVNLIFHSRDLLVLFNVIVLIYLIHMKKNHDKFKSLNTSELIVGLFILYFLFTFLSPMLLNFI